MFALLMFKRVKSQDVERGASMGVSIEQKWSERVKHAESVCWAPKEARMMTAKWQRKDEVEGTGSSQRGM